jgi:predicted phage terminase large subunit-like protein
MSLVLDDLDLNTEAISRLLENLHTLTRSQQEELLADIELFERKKQIERAKLDFLAFCHFVYPNFKEGPHHRHMKPLLHGLNAGTEPRLTVSMPPRFGKSETIAYLYVAWYLGHNPTHHIMMVTHTADLSADFGRKVRNLLDSEVYHEIFPETVVARDKSAASNWSTTVGGKYLAIGIGANVAGHGAHLLIGDDLVSEQAVLSSDPDKTFAQAWEYMQVGPLQRLMPDGKIIMIGCMTAETRVLMADGTEKELQHIKVGDAIATYDAGEITTSHVKNWIEHHPDFIYKITTTSGKIVRANKRHPFLVDRNGVRLWVRVRDLKVGDCMVGASSTHPDTGVNGKVSPVQLTGATAPHQQKDSAVAATVRSLGARVNTGLPQNKSVRAISSTVTEWLRKLTTLCSKVKAAAVQSVRAPQLKRTQGRGSSRNCTLTTATTAEKSEGYCAITAIWPLDTQTQKHAYSQPQRTYATTPDAIVDITEDGYEPVFDIEVERTENFIANGVVSHNTRWGKKDPIGRALQWAEQNSDSTPWHEVRFPAILPSGKSLWPEQWPVEQLLAKKAGMFPQFWAAQYMQEPTSEEGALVKREWWRIWKSDKPPKCDFLLQSWDTAHGKNDSSDPSGVQTWGIFYNEDELQDQLILLDAWKGRKEFPELKKFALEYYKEWEPDSVIIEKKAAGAPLIQELRAIGVPVQEYTPSRGADKRVRINSVADIFASGMVWRPDVRWAQEVVDEIAEFPNGEHDEMVDCASQALMRFRQGGFIRLKSDENDDNDLVPRRRAAYY